MGNETHHIKGILLGWKEVRIGADYSKTLLKLQMLANIVQAASERKIQRREKSPQTGSQYNREQFTRIKPPGRLIVNTEIYPCMKRACVALDALRQTRTKNTQSKGIEHKAHMGAYGKESKDRKQDLINGKFEHMLDTASKVAGLTGKQYRDWRRTEKLEAKKENGRSRSVSRRRKRREAAKGQTEREKRAQKDKTNKEHRKKRREDKREMRRSVYRRKRYKKKYGRDSRKPTEQKPTKQSSGSTEDGRKETGKKWMHGEKSSQMKRKTEWIERRRNND